MKITKKWNNTYADTSSKIDHTTARIYANLRTLIIEKKLTPGSKINQNVLAKTFNVSRTPIVKALHKLETQGLVDNIPKKGFKVHRISILELLDLFALREALDTIIISELTETITDEQIQQLEEVFCDFEGLTAEIDESRYWQCDKTFHSLLLNFSTNELAKKVDDHFQIFNRAFVGGLLRKPSETLPEHMKIILALKQKDRDTAIDAAISHIHKTKTFLQEVVKKLRKLGIDPAEIPLNELHEGSL